MSRCKEKIDLDNMDEALGKLFSAQIKFGREALKLLGTGCNSAVGSLKKMKLPQGSSCCEMPEPCWMPNKIDEICCQLRPGDAGEICFVIANEDFVPHSYSVVAAGEHSALVGISNKNFTLGPKERRVVSAKFTMPARDGSRNSDSCCQCNDYEAVIWVQGCQNHYLNWYINSNEKTQKCCYEVCVNDAPNNELNWYDHFHVLRSCNKPVVTANVNPKVP